MDTIAATWPVALRGSLARLFLAAVPLCLAAPATAADRLEISTGEPDGGPVRIAVHLVDDEYDHGRILLQRAVPVLADDTPESLAARVFAAECEALPEAIRRFRAPG